MKKEVYWMRTFDAFHATALRFVAFILITKSLTMMINAFHAFAFFFSFSLPFCILIENYSKCFVGERNSILESWTLVCIFGFCLDIVICFFTIKTIWIFDDFQMRWKSNEKKTKEFNLNRLKYLCILNANVCNIRTWNVTKSHRRIVKYFRINFQ